MKVYGFYRATSHMLRKFFNTQLINVGMVKKSGNIGWVEI
ncbi:hypothetical protein MB9_0751 [Methanobacterium formicicum]|uniref:Uncharacterized protein n=1 Tax=Methanobacterium formicicum TaxID=2162 RepID=A0A0S4FN14_METFO|nr:hypothetical protein MB9_0751 [Methanobacterium formicicum]